MTNPIVSVVMGSQSDWPTMKIAADMLKLLVIPHEKRIVSAHRTPERLMKFAMEAKGRGIRVIIAGAGGAAHLPGMISALITLPVCGVPVKTSALGGLDSLYSIVQMPGGVPVATFAIGEAGAKNAALHAAAILALTDDQIAARLEGWRGEQTKSVAEHPAETEEKKQ